MVITFLTVAHQRGCSRRTGSRTGAAPGQARRPGSDGCPAARQPHSHTPAFPARPMTSSSWWCGTVDRPEAPPPGLSCSLQIQTKNHEISFIDVKMS